MRLGKTLVVVPIRGWGKTPLTTKETPHETQEKLRKKLHIILCSVLVNIDQQKKVINNFYYVSVNIILSNLNFTDIFK